MDGQVGLAGGGEGIDLLVAIERLQGVAEPRRGAAVVDQQGGAAVHEDALPQLGAQGGLGGGLFEHLAGRGVRHAGG